MTEDRFGLLNVFPIAHGKRTKFTSHQHKRGFAESVDKKKSEMTSNTTRSRENEPTDKGQKFTSANRHVLFRINDRTGCFVRPRTQMLFW